MTAPGRLPPGHGKTDAVVELARRAGIADVDPYHHDLDPLFDTLLAALKADANLSFSFADAASLDGLGERLVIPAQHRPVPLPLFANGRPDCFPPVQGSEDSPAFRLLTIPDGCFLHMARAPVVLLPDGRTVVRDYSSRFSRLVHFYDFEAGQVLQQAPRIAGAALVLFDDIFPLNYSHWLLDTLPRLAALGERRDVTLVTTDQDAAFKRETLALCGFAPTQVLAVPDFTAIRADLLLVPRDTRDMPHPAHKAAPWAIEFLRARVGFPALRGADGRGPRRLYVSRNDAAGRRVVNEDALLRLLVPMGYQAVTLSGRSVAEQVRLFAGAARVVGLHGAGLSNVAFCPTGARLVEIFPASYGTAAFYVMAAGQGMSYVSYVAHEVRSGPRTQLDDVALDIADFASRVATLL